MNTTDKPIVIEFRIARRTVRRALVVSAALLSFGAGVCWGVPITFSNGSVLTSNQLNTNFANLDQRLSALEGNTGTGREYTVDASSAAIIANHTGGPTSALCKPGDHVLMGSCWGERTGGTLLIYDEQPIFSGTNGWQCSADNPSPADGTLHVLAVCTGPGAPEAAP